jgi:hypothetical protein
MGICYTYLLYDEFDWDYAGTSKCEILGNLKVELPVADILATWRCFAVIDLDKNSPQGHNAQCLQKYCDIAYFCGDTSNGTLHKVEFKQLMINSS